MERFEDERSNKYQVDGEWRECTVREEVIEIKGADAYKLNVRETHHGPILDPTDFDKGIEKGPYSHLFESNVSVDKENEEYYLRYSFCATFLKTKSEIGKIMLEQFENMYDQRDLPSVAKIYRGLPYPNLNYVIADTEGNFGWTTNGLIPIRPSLDTYHPLLPQPGWLSKCDWMGYIPEEELPSNMNPQCGYVVSCNNRMVDEDKYPYYLGSAFAMGFRAKRACQLIDEQIAEQKQIDVQFLESMQLDVHDLSAEEMVNGVLKKLNLDQVIKKHTVTLPQWVQFTMNSVIPKVIRDGVEMKVEYYNESVNREKAEYGWKLLSEWDFEYTTESLAATVYDAFILVLIRRVSIAGIYRGFSDRKDPTQRENEKKEDEDDGDIAVNEETLKMAEKMSETLMTTLYNKVFGGTTAFLLNYNGILSPAFTMFGCDTAEADCWWIRNYGSRENVVVMSLIDALDCIAFWSETEDRKQWKWGSLHQLEAFHPVSAKLGPKPFNSESYPVAGSQHSLCMFKGNREGVVENPLKGIRASCPVWRQVIDCSDWSKCKCVLPMGTSAQMASPYYQNQLKLLVDGEYIPMLWGKADVEEHKVSELVCDPESAPDQSDCKIL